MTQTIHRVISHTHELIQALPLPLGVLTEEAAESKNKYYKRDFNYHSRCSSKVNKLSDIFHHALKISDPLISCNYFAKQKPEIKRTLPIEVLQLLDIPEHEINDLNLSDSHDDEIVFEYLDEYWESIELVNED